MAEPKQGSEEQGPRDPEQIQRDIEATREELADTVSAVAEKADVKAQAKRKVDETKEKAKAKVGGAKDSAKGATPDSAAAAGQQAIGLARENPVAMRIAGAFVIGVVVGRILSR